jgi:acyl carrier protein
MNRDEIREGVLKLLAKFAGRGAKKTDLNEATTLDELDVNSARMIDIVLDLEDQFGVTIDDSNTPKLKTVGDLVSLVDNLVNAQKA